MPDVYNSTTVEFQARRPTYVSTTFTKYGLPILGAVSIGIGGIVFLTSLLAPEEPPAWIPLIFAIVLVIFGISIILLWKFWERKRTNERGFMVLKPRIKDFPETAEPIVQAQEEEFVNQEGVKNTLLKEPYEDDDDQSIPSSKSTTPTPTAQTPELPVHCHYKPRHFSGHGYGRKVANFAPLAKAEDITPSLRSSFSSLAYVQELDSESSISIDSALFDDLKI